MGLEPGCGGAAALQSPREPVASHRTEGSWKEKQTPDGATSWRRCQWVLPQKEAACVRDVPWHACITDKGKSGIKQKITWKHFPVLWIVFWGCFGFFPLLPQTWRYENRSTDKSWGFFCWLDIIVCWKLKGSRMPSEQSYICCSKLKKVTVIL